jgi:hypothetical protein
VFQSTYPFKKEKYMTSKKIDCFGSFNGSRVCENCPVKRDCKLTLVAVGFDIFRSLLTEMLYALPEGNYTDSDRMPMLVDQVRGVILPASNDTLQIFDDLDAESHLDLSKIV